MMDLWVWLLLAIWTPVSPKQPFLTCHDVSLYLGDICDARPHHIPALGSALHRVGIGTRWRSSDARSRHP
jgi:hypothetical protein